MSRTRSDRSFNKRRSRTAYARRRGAASYRRRRTGFMLAITAITVIVGALVAPYIDRAVHEVTLPLHHQDIIRQQAARKHLDPTLIAAVIYAESRFRPRTSRAGAKGLMQLLPSTADYIARKSGGTRFERGDLATPQINISYGSFYLRYLLDRYNGNEVLALAAYNAGEGKVDQWVANAKYRGEAFRLPKHIPFEETRAYVTKVLKARQRYREDYGHEFGLNGS